MAPRIPGKARLKQPGKNHVPEMANGDTSPNHPNLKMLGLVVTIKLYSRLQANRGALALFDGVRVKVI